MRGTVDTRQNNMIVLLYVSFVERSKTCECNHNWAGKLAPRHVSKPNQQWWMNVILLCISSYSLSIYSPAMHSFKYPSFAAPQISFHPSLYVPLVCRLFNLILLIAIAELFLRALPILYMSNSTVQAHTPTYLDGAFINDLALNVVPIE